MLNGTKMHVTSYNTADWIFFQAKLAGGEHEGEHALFFVDKDTPGVRLLREPRYSHTYPDTHAMRRVRGRAGAGSRIWSAPRATACRSPTSGSATSG